MVSGWAKASDPDPGILVGAGSGSRYFGRARIRFLSEHPDPDQGQFMLSNFSIISNYFFYPDPINSYQFDPNPGSEILKHKQLKRFVY